MKPIGGYFELEINKGRNNYHNTISVMKSGRVALQYILSYIKPSLVYIPYYVCDALLEPFKIANVNYRFYEINDLLEPAESIDLIPGEYFLYVNYMDLKREAVESLSRLYKDKLIIDCTQAFFMQGNGVSWFFNSCRKFFGVPDGSYVYAPDGIQLPLNEIKNEAYIIDHLLKRFNGHANDGYKYFLENEKLVGNGIAGISKLSEYILSQINYGYVAEKRKENYNFLHLYLKNKNLCTTSLRSDAVPMCYPLFSEQKINKTKFFDQQLFIPTFWQDTISRIEKGFYFEKKLTEHLLPLPIDQRYNKDDLERIISIVLEAINKN